MHRALNPRNVLSSLSTRPYPFASRCPCSTTASSQPPPPPEDLLAENEARARSYLEKYSSHRHTSLTPSPPSPPLPLKKRIPPITGPLPNPTTLCHLLEHSHGALDVQTVDVRAKAPFADCLLICTGRSERHVAAIAEGIMLDMRRSGVLVDGEVVGICGTDAADWKAVDIGSVVVHVMTEEARIMYDLEGLWTPDSVPKEARSNSVQ